MLRALALSDTFWKGIAVTVAALILFVGSVYVILSAVFGLRMGYLVLAVSLFGWMIILSGLWVFGATFFGAGTPVNQGPRGTEPTGGCSPPGPARCSPRRSRDLDVARLALA
jgi:hypothetical protein